MSEALMELWGPFEMGGFEGCTDQNPEVCACAHDTQPTCVLCDREIEPGEQAWSRQWPCYETLPLGHKDQDWDVISWHNDCEPATETPPDPPEPEPALAGERGDGDA